MLENRYGFVQCTAAYLERSQAAAQAGGGAATLKDLLSVMLAASYNEAVAAAVLTGEQLALPIEHRGVETCRSVYHLHC